MGKRTRARAMETVTLWMGVVTGVLTAVVTAYGLRRTWQDRRREQRARLADAARVAVRVADAAYVRPLLRARLEACVRAFLVEPDPDHHATTARLRLFCRLQAEVRLAPDEKRAARSRAYRELADLLRGMPQPPVRVPRPRPADADADVDAPLPRLLRALEVAYSLCPRPSSALVAELGAFAGGLGALDPPAGADAQRRRAQRRAAAPRTPSPSPR